MRKGAGNKVKSYKTAIDNLFKERENLLILGLTGRTGSGCSTVAKILGKEYSELEFIQCKREELSEADKYKFEIIKKYMQVDGRWVPFQVVQGSCVILSFLFEKKDEDASRSSEILIKYLYDIQNNSDGKKFKIDNFLKLKAQITGIDYMFERVQKNPLCNIEKLELLSNEELEELYNVYIVDMVNYKQRLKKILLQYSCYEENKSKLQDEPPIKYHLYTYLLQKFGNNIRSSGDPFVETFNQDKYHDFAKRIELMIEIIIQYNKKIRKTEKSRICIDAIRNANESNYLKDKYRFYYLLSISTDEQSRAKRLSQLNNDERINIDKIEYSSKLEPQEIFYHQNISSCFEIADVHLINDNEKGGKYLFITWQLVKYIALMIHPGLVMPTHIERCMQLAFNTKYNSGCLSRQVGAVITGPDFAIKAVGWNDVPKGHISCNLRDVEECYKGKCQECYSEYEMDNEDFRDALSNVRQSLRNIDLDGRKHPFCFKDIYNGYTNEKNQVYTRALHAEENAFLQISKYGGQGVKGGYLFCTASPCELCSKKAYQLGIKRVYYIDPYPGISQKHILEVGKKGEYPKMERFYGAIGSAYITLYRPLMAVKDELELVSGINCKKVAHEGINENKKPEVNDLYYNKVEFSIEFISRETIESTRDVSIEVKKGKYNKLERKLTWTGSSYDETVLIESDGYKIKDFKDKASPYRYDVEFNKTINEGEKINYKVLSRVKDEAQLMHPYIAHMVKNPVEKLKLSLTVPNDSHIIKNVVCKRYADMEMKYHYQDPNMEIAKKEEDKKIIYNLEISKPNLFYTYSIEWEFNDL